MRIFKLLINTATFGALAALWACALDGRPAPVWLEDLGLGFSAFLFLLYALRLLLELTETER